MFFLSLGGALILLVSVIRQWKILSFLVGLEGLMMAVMCWVSVFSASVSEPSSTFLVILVVAAAEASLGLSLLVSFVRYKGNDLMSSLS